MELHKFHNTSSLRLFTSSTQVVGCCPGSRTPATPRAAVEAAVAALGIMNPARGVPADKHQRKLKTDKTTGGNEDQIDS